MAPPVSCITRSRWKVRSGFVVSGLIERGLRRVHVVNRSPDRAAAMQQRFGARVVPSGWEFRNDLLAVPAAIDEVSILTAAQFATHGQRFQELSAQAARIQATLAATLASSGNSYAATEAANAASAG